MVVCAGFGSLLSPGLERRIHHFSVLSPWEVISLHLSFRLVLERNLKWSHWPRISVGRGLHSSLEVFQ